MTRRRRPVVALRTEIVDDFPGRKYATEQVGYLLEHLDHMRRLGRSDRTILARRQVLTKCAEILRADPAEASFEDLEAWQRSLCSLDTVRWETALIRPYYRYIQARGFRQDNPAALLPTPREPRRLPRPIAEDRLMAAVAAAPPNVLPWLLLAGWSALRAAEIADLSVEDFWRDADDQVWVQVQGKGERRRDVPVPDWAWQRIVPLLPVSGPCWSAGRGEGEVTAKLVSRQSNRYLRRLGFRDTLHALRHRAASEALHASGGDVRMVQQLLGHANLATLHVYTLVRPAAVAAAVVGLARPPAVDVDIEERRVIDVDQLDGVGRPR